MIDVVQLRTVVAAMPGEVIAVPRAQLVQLLGELETGQRARRSLAELASRAAIAASHSGAPR